MTKLEVRHRYLNNLETLYAGRVDYSPGSRAREMAIKAADAALAGHIRLEGDAWFAALKLAGLDSRSSRAQIAALPSE